MFVNLIIITFLFNNLLNKNHCLNNKLSLEIDYYNWQIKTSLNTLLMFKFIIHIESCHILKLED